MTTDCSFSSLTGPESMMDQFRAPTSMTPEELGDSLARLVWESFTDFLAKGDAEIGLEELGIPTEDGIPDEAAVEESLIFLMWAHTRGAQLAFTGRVHQETLKQGLDSLHRAVFEDLVKNGTPAAQLPLFEQKIAARYAEYHRAAAESDTALGGAVVRHLAISGSTDRMAHAMTNRALAVANPLRDFLEEVELVPG